MMGGYCAVFFIVKRKDGESTGKKFSKIRMQPFWYMCFMKIVFRKRDGSACFHPNTFGPSGLIFLLLGRFF